MNVFSTFPPFFVEINDFLTNVTTKFMCWIDNRYNFACTHCIYAILRCLLLPMMEMAGKSDKHQYHDTSSDTEDYSDDRRRRVYKNRLR